MRPWHRRTRDPVDKIVKLCHIILVFPLGRRRSVRDLHDCRRHGLLAVAVPVDRILEHAVLVLRGCVELGRFRAEALLLSFSHAVLDVVVADKGGEETARHHVRDDYVRAVRRDASLAV